MAGAHDDTSNPHDALVKAVFRVPACFALLLRLALPTWLFELLDLATLAEAPSEQTEGLFDRGETDLLFTAALRDGSGALAPLLEHRSTPQQRCVLRLARYERLIWHRAERLGEPVPLVVPLVLYQGPGPWPSARTLRELLAPAGLAAELARSGADTRLLSDLAPAFLELGRIPIPELLALAPPAPALARMALVVLKAEREGLDWSQVFRASVAVLRDLWQTDRVGYGEICSYIGAVGEPEAVMKLEDEARILLGKEAARPFVTWAEHHRAKGRAEGRAEGLAEGRLEERRALLVQTLTTLHGALGPDVIARIDAGTPEQLSRWFERAVRGLPPGQVFADD